MNRQEVIDLLPALAEKMKADYLEYSKRMKYDAAGYVYDVQFEVGNKFVRVVSVTPGNRSASGFVQLDDDKKFPAGTLLKAASWAAPAKNFSRGLISDLDNAKIRWTGLG